MADSILMHCNNLASGWLILELAEPNGRRRQTAANHVIEPDDSSSAEGNIAFDSWLGSKPKCPHSDMKPRNYEEQLVLMFSYPGR